MVLARREKAKKSRETKEREKSLESCNGKVGGWEDTLRAHQVSDGKWIVVGPLMFARQTSTASSLDVDVVANDATERSFRSIGPSAAL